MEYIKFEWDEKKNTINKRKHGVSFEEARTVFQDEQALVFDDPEHSKEEERFLIIGVATTARLLVVSHCVRDSGDTIRIISARKATRNEAAVYEDWR